MELTLLYKIKELLPEYRLSTLKKYVHNFNGNLTKGNSLSLQDKVENRKHQWSNIIKATCALYESHPLLQRSYLIKSVVALTDGYTFLCYGLADRGVATKFGTHLLRPLFLN
ncbi:hypothetical protein [Chondrinema litorale]|uniref:hypothetical protein n=1 Tax=Chondrinema litorale TaxID=2994555 RepID=UPI00254325C3|nr:hypothetical protein [Chondrinema litorale]UZS00118.1 hypothetical protein OQ292_39870 [Chondrinema litorale]